MYWIFTQPMVTFHHLFSYHESPHSFSRLQLQNYSGESFHIKGSGCVDGLKAETEASLGMWEGSHHMTWSRYHQITWRFHIAHINLLPAWFIVELWLQHKGVGADGRVIISVCVVSGTRVDEALLHSCRLVMFVYHCSGMKEYVQLFKHHKSSLALF